MGQLRWDKRGKAGARHLGHDIGYDAGQDSPDRSVWTGWPVRSAWKGQAGQDKEDGMLRHDSKDQIVGTGELGIKAMEEDSWEGTGETGQADRTGGTEQIAQGR
jgi:hypothetical protein